MTGERDRNVQIPRELYEKLLIYFFNPLADWEAEDLWQQIKSGLDAKLQAQIRRDLFCRFKRAGTAEEREAARIKYLDAVGMKESFRSKDPPEDPPE